VHWSCPDLTGQLSAHYRRCPVSAGEGCTRNNSWITTVIKWQEILQFIAVSVVPSPSIVTCHHMLHSVTIWNNSMEGTQALSTSDNLSHPQNLDFPSHSLLLSPQDSLLPASLPDLLVTSPTASELTSVDHCARLQIYLLSYSLITSLVKLAIFCVWTVQFHGSFILTICTAIYNNG